MAGKRPVLTLQQASAMLDVPLSTLRWHCVSGLLSDKAFQVDGRWWRIYATDVRWFKRRYVPLRKAAR